MKIEDFRNLTKVVDLGGGPPRSSVTSPESGALIGPDPLRGPAVMAGSSNIPLPAR